MRKTYSEKLLDPRWQKRRLEILQRDNFTCQSCGSTTKTLHIHHRKYGKNPWVVKDNQLITYCDNCHFIIEYIIKHIPYCRVFRIKKNKLSAANFHPVIAYCYSEQYGYQVFLYKYTTASIDFVNCITVDTLNDIIAEFENIKNILKLDK